MIPIGHVLQWSANSSWADLRQVEQDLVISRAICDLFNHQGLDGKIAFRGGTAIHKLVFEKALRYSEDIDLVQTGAEPIGGIIDAVRSALGWLGRCSTDRTPHSTHLVFRFQPETGGGEKLRLKVEINTREHQSLLALETKVFSVRSDWHQAEAKVATFVPEELLGTKLRALLQRNKNRDLFDLYRALALPGLDLDKIIACLQHYLSRDGHSITRAIAEERMLRKLERSLTADVAPLLPVGVVFDERSALQAFEQVWRELITRISGEGWKSAPGFIRLVRGKKYPGLLKEIPG
ncbi:MAG: nucleotidyl transferase AbiEii/AbiGii toxin family protein [Gemmataceae bacterium]